MNVRTSALAVCLLFSATSKLLPESSQDPQNVITLEDRFITQCHAQLIGIEKILRSLNVTVTKEKLFTATRRKRIQAFISQIMHLTNIIKQESFRNADMDSCQLLVEFNHRLISLIKHQCATKFRTAHQFDEDSFILALQSRKVLSGEDIAKQFQNTWKLIATIEKEGLGLTRINRIARWIDDKLIAPSQRHSIPTRTSGGVGALFFGGYFWNKFHSDDENVLPLLYDQTDKLDRLWTSIIKHKAPIGEIGGAIVLGWMLREYAASIKPVIDKKISVWLNQSKGGSYLKEADRIDEKTEKVRFDDVHGHDEIKRYFQFLVNYLEDSETHDRQGVRPSRGILCIGDTRTGKTYCINAFLEEVNQMLLSTGQIGKFRLIKPSVLRIKIEGMERILREAKAKAPCILFIDEIDLLDLQRTGENRTLSEFLTAMGDAVNSNDSKRQIFIIAATNCPETLDKALRQPGRFGKELRFEYPNFKDRIHFIRSKVKEFILPEQEQSFDFEKLAHYTNEQSYEAMNLFIKDAMMKAKINNNGELTQQHLESALEENIFHIIPAHSKDIPHQEKQILAAHFAGKAVALSLLDANMKLAKVTIKQVMTELKEKAMGSHLWDSKNKEQQRFEYGKVFTYCEQDSINMQTHQEKMSLIKLHLAGFVAEELLLGSCGYSCHVEDDTNIALSIAKSLAFQGVDESTVSKRMVQSCYDKAVEIKDTCMQEIRDLLSAHKETLSLIAQDLLKEQTLDSQHIKERIESIVTA